MSYIYANYVLVAYIIHVSLYCINFHHAICITVYIVHEMLGFIIVRPFLTNSHTNVLLYIENLCTFVVGTFIYP